MKWLFIIWLILVALLICIRLQVNVQWPAITAEAQAPTATPTPVGATCTITGRVFNPDGTPLANGTVQFNSVVQQTLQGGAVIPPLFKSTTSDPNGNIAAFGLIQGLQGQFTFCSPSAGGCGNPTPVLIPVAATADISAILIGIQLSSGGNINAANLNVTGNATIGGTLEVAGPTTLGSATINSLNVTGTATFQSQVVFGGTQGACFPDNGCWTNNGQVSVTHIGIGQWPAFASVSLQTGETSIVSGVSAPDALGTNINMDYFSGVHMNAGGTWIADVSYPLLFGQVSAASNGAETSWSSYGPQTIGQPVNFSNRVQYMALRPNIAGTAGGVGLFIESGGIDVLNGGISANGGSLGNGITASFNQNGATTVQAFNPGVGNTSTALVRATTGYVADLGMIGGSANLGGFFSADRGYVQSNGPNGLLIEATGGAGYASQLYLSAPNANLVRVVGNQHFGIGNDGVSVPTVVGACGGGGQMFGESTDVTGSVSVGPAAATSCVVQFAAAFQSVNCVCSTRAATWCAVNPSASGFTLEFGAPITGFASWICLSNS